MRSRRGAGPGLALVLGLGPTTAATAQTADGQTPAVEDICTKWGLSGDTPFPTCQDSDDDGVPNGLDNCPDVANADQADANPSTPEGDACEPAVVTCPCLGTGDPAAPATIEALIASAEDFAAQYSALVVDVQCNSQFQYSDDPVDGGIAGWGAEAATTVCALGATVTTTNPSIDILFDSFIDTLTPEEDAACQAVIDALKAADPFGICTD